MLGASMVVRLVTGPVIGLVADLVGTRLVLALTAVGSGLIALFFLFVAGFWPIFIVCLVHAVTLAPLSPLADALALNASQHEGVFAYGWIRGLGSAAFILGTLMSGVLIARFGIDSIIVAGSIFFLATVVPIPRLRSPPPAPSAVARGGFATLVAIPSFRRLLVVAGLVLGSHAMSDTFAIIHWRAAGMSAPLTGLLWSESVASEIVVFVLLGPYLLRRLGPARCAAISAAAGALRWSVFAMTSNALAMAATQCLHGLTFSLMHLVGMRIIATVVPEELSATAQTVYGLLGVGIATAAFTLVSGEIYGVLGARAFWLMAALCAAAFCAVRGLGTDSAK